MTNKKLILSSLNGLRANSSYGLADPLPFTESNVQWEAGDYIRKTTIVATVDALINQLNLCENDAYQEFVYVIIRRLFSSVRSYTNNSTNIYSNAINNSKREACLEVIDSLLPYLEPDTI